MLKHIFIACIFSFLVIGCGGKKETASNKTFNEDSYINPNSDIAIAGSVNFDNDENLSIYSAILKNVVGDKSGAYIGHQMDKLAAFFERDLDHSELLRAGEGLILEFNSNTDFYFKTGKTNLNESSKQSLSQIIAGLNKYPKMNLVIETHTDAAGDEEVNMKLSQERVQSIQAYLTAQGVENNRITVKAIGENQPKVDNITQENREANRRVVFGFYASEELKEEAKDKTE